MEQALTIINNDISMMVYNPPKGVRCVDIRRAIANTEIVGKLNAIERAVFMASTARVANEYTERELAKEMAETLKWVAKDIGIRDTESADWNVTVVRVMQIMKRYYEWFTVKDVRMAFEMAVTGELNDYLPKDRNGNPDKEHYQMFNVEYFCKIMNAYRDYRNAVINKATAMVPKPEYESDHSKDDFYANEINKQAVGAYLYYKYHGRMPHLTPIVEMLIYNALSRIGMVDEIEVTEQEKRLVLRRTINELSNQKRLYDMKRVAAQGLDAPEIQHPAMVLARYKTLKMAFEEMIAEEIQITDYIAIQL